MHSLTDLACILIVDELSGQTLQVSWASKSW